MSIAIALMVYRIDRGRHGDVSLDGLKFALVIRSGRIMADGGWVFGSSSTRAANEAQRQRVGRNRQRQGRRPAADDPRQPGERISAASNSATIDFTAEGLRRVTEIPGMLAFEIEGVASRNRSGEPFYIDNTAHPANRRLALARSQKTEVQGFGLALSLLGKGNNGHFAPFAWGRRR